VCSAPTVVGAGFSGLLALYASRLSEAIRLLDDFLSGGSAASLHSAALLLTELGREVQAPLAAYGQAILAALCLDAGLRLRERALEVERRGLREGDIEYVADVRDVLHRVVATIESGEYERSYREMVSRRAEG